MRKSIANSHRITLCIKETGREIYLSVRMVALLLEEPPSFALGNLIAYSQSTGKFLRLHASELTLAQERESCLVVEQISSYAWREEEEVQLLNFFPRWAESKIEKSQSETIFSLALVNLVHIARLHPNFPNLKFLKTRIRV